jgi:FG-GAP-like repeat
MPVITIGDRPACLATPDNHLVRAAGVERKRAGRLIRLLCLVIALAGAATASEVAFAGAIIFSGALNASSPTMANRITRNGVGSTCGAPKAFPGPTATAGTQYQVASYLYKGPSRCVTITLSATTCGTNGSSAFLSLCSGPFDPNNLATNYMGDIGSSVTGATAAVALTSGQTIQLVVNGTLPGLNCTFIIESDNSGTHDLNGDQRSDIVWRDTSGDLGFWLMNGAVAISQGGLSGVAPNWSIVGQRDFSGDGSYDLLWRDTSGTTAVWFMNGTVVASTRFIGNIPANWTVVGTGDFNSDGMGDILWEDNNGNLAVWLMNGATVIGSGGLGNVHQPHMLWPASATSMATVRATFCGATPAATYSSGS